MRALLALTLLIFWGLVTMTESAPRDLARALMGAEAADRRPRMPGMLSDEEQLRLGRDLHAGRMTLDQYDEAVGRDRPPPGVDPDLWRFNTKPPPDFVVRDGPPPPGKVVRPNPGDR